MSATQQTRAMLDWWTCIGVDRADLAVRRSTGAMLWHRDVVVAALPLAWARAENAHQADIYIRPARGHAWPFVFVDDVAVDRAHAVASHVDALLVATSPAGGCHVWIRCDHALDEYDRMRAQREWIDTLHGDPGSVSGEHLGRLAGFKNWKRSGCWVNVVAATSAGRPWATTAAGVSNTVTPTGAATPRTSVAVGGSTRDTSPSGHDWGWVCGLLETGHAPHAVYHQLVQHARVRRGADADRYARRTIEKALAHLARRHVRPT